MEWGSGAGSPPAPQLIQGGQEGPGATAQLHQPVAASWPGVTPLAVKPKLDLS